jgi:uncharacterized protein (TIGR02145 family)
MKQILLFLAVFTLTFLSGCSTNSDDKSDATTTVIPESPTNLIVTAAAATQINLSWTDNSSNETGFEIQRKTGSESFAFVGEVNANVSTYSDTGLSPNTTYFYKVFSYNSAGNSAVSSNEVTAVTSTTSSTFTITTLPVNGITISGALSGGTISNYDGSIITARGVVWDTSPDPITFLASKTMDGSGVGTFLSTIVGLTANTTFYVRAYATNSAGTTFFGNQLSFTTPVPSPTIIADFNGNIYSLITVCNQTWTKSNFNASKYNDGTTIPEVTDPADWNTLTTGAWCYYNNDAANGTTYGKLYNYYAVLGIYDEASRLNPSLRKKLAPTGWHVPTDADWTTLTNCLGGSMAAGGKMKEIGTVHWDNPNMGATNISGFTALPGGQRDFFGEFTEIKKKGYWYGLSLDGEMQGWSRTLFYISPGVAAAVGADKWGYSVRCIRD